MACLQVIPEQGHKMHMHIVEKHLIMYNWNGKQKLVF